MASGHVNRIYRPNTWLHRPILQNVKKALANSEPSTHGTFRKYACSGELPLSGQKSGARKFHDRPGIRCYCLFAEYAVMELEIALSPGCACSSLHHNRSSIEAARLPTKIITTVGLPDRLSSGSSFSHCERNPGFERSE